jgi:hypothetical protein
MDLRLRRNIEQECARCGHESIPSVSVIGIEQPLSQTSPQKNECTARCPKLKQER